MLLIGCFVISLLCVSCVESEENTKVVLTIGLDRGELFRIGDSTCQLSEALVYYATMKNQYELVFGEELWAYAGEKISLEDHLREVVLARIAQVKVMTLLAVQYDIILTAQEVAKVEQAASSYYATFTKEEREALSFTEKDAIKLYEEYTIAVKVYDYMIRDINPEISDDEARIVTVNHMVIPYGNYVQALQIHADLKGGSTFQEVARRNQEIVTTIVSFGNAQGVLDARLEQNAFFLATNEVGDMVETIDGYEIIQCVNTLNREQTDENKLKIMEARRKEMFNIQYEEFVNSLVKHIDFAMWEDATTNLNPAVDTVEFFDIYEGKF